MFQLLISDWLAQLGVMFWRRHDHDLLVWHLILFHVILDKLFSKIRAQHFDLVYGQVQEKVTHHANYEAFKLLDIFLWLYPVFIIIKSLSL